MTPWIYHGALTTALGEQSCGCALIQKAVEEPDEHAQEAMMAAGREAQQLWGCPVDGFKPLLSLSPKQQEALNAVERLTKADCSGCITCPNADLYPIHNGKPNQVALDIKRSIENRNWRDKGQLQLREGSEPKNTVVKAIDCLDQAFNIREAYDDKKRQEKYDREQKARDEERNPNVRERIRG